MVKLSIYNMKSFLETVNECSGSVNLFLPDGRKENINKEHDIQNELLQKHRENKGCIQFSLDIPSPKDYMRIIFFAIGDC